MAGLQVAIPGQKLGSVSEHVAGPGTYVERGYVYASTIGRIHREPPSSTSTSTSRTSSRREETTRSFPTISVIRPGLEDASTSFSSSSSTNILPPVGGIVLARVTRINPRQANVAILVIGNHVCADEFPGIIRYGMNICVVLCRGFFYDKKKLVTIGGKGGECDDDFNPLTFGMQGTRCESHRKG